MQVGEGVNKAGVESSDNSNEENEEKCPKCGAIWKKTSPTLAEVRSAVSEVYADHAQEIKTYSLDALAGYLGSIATGVVGNEAKIHYGMEPDIRGECNTFYDIDGLIISNKAKRVRKRNGKRWASSNKETRTIERNIRASLHSRSELKYMKSGKDGFSLVMYLPSEESKVISKGCKILII